MNPLPSGRNSFLIFFSAISLIGLMSHFSDKPGMLWLFFLSGAVISAVRSYLIWNDEKARTSARPLDFSKIRTVNLTKINTWLKNNVRGHDAVIDNLTERLRGNFQLAKPGRAMGTFLLAGPTGTGKSFLSHLVSQALYPGIEPVVLRMNQFKNPDDVFTLIGSPPGRAGFEMGGALTRPILENRMRVIILDELDKAHGDVLDCLYDILDTGTCREKSTGKLLDFSGCIFFGTTNSGVEEIRSRQEKAGAVDEIRHDVNARDALLAGGKFSKAFLARWERVYFMDALSEAHVAEVACLNLQKYWKEFGVHVRFASPELLLNTIIHNRDFKEYGVRQLMGYLRLKSDPLVQAAKAQGKTEVSLGIDSNGEFILAQPVKVAYGTSKKVS